MNDTRTSAGSAGRYPVASPWFAPTRLDDGVTVVIEPHVHVLERANLFLVEGSERDLILDTGMGVVPLKPTLDALRAEPGKELVCVSTHTHMDHIGGVHEFDVRLVHPIEADEMARPSGVGSLFVADIPEAVREMFLRAGYPPLDELLIDAFPHAGYDPASYALRGAPATGLLEEGDVVDLGDVRFEIVHLPGHSPGGIGLFDASSGTLYAGDAIYDGPLIFDGRGMSVPDYVRTFDKLLHLDVRRVHGGHDPSFDAPRMREIIEDYLRRWESA